MKNIIKYNIIIFWNIIFAQDAGTIIKKPIYFSPSIPKTIISNENSRNFSINHGFSLISKSSQLGSQTMGIYSNKIKYIFSNDLTFNSNINFINSNEFQYNNNQNFDIEYELGLKYKLSENTQILFQISNYVLKHNNIGIYNSNF